MEKLTQQEHKCRLAFAERQFELYKLRVIQAQLKASYFLTLTDNENARNEMRKADNFITFLNECNETIDMHYRAINAG